MNRKAVNLLLENFMFILFIVILVIPVSFNVTKTGSQAVLYEQTYAKQIALIIDKAKVGTNIKLELDTMYKLARKNDYYGHIVTIDNKKNKVNVKLANGKGYDQYFFNDVDVKWNYEEEGRNLVMNITESSENKIVENDDE